MTATYTSIKRASRTGFALALTLVLAACASPAPVPETDLAAYLSLSEDGKVTCSTDVVEPAGFVLTAPAPEVVDEDAEIQLCVEAVGQVPVKDIEHAYQVLAQKDELVTRGVDVSSVGNLGEQLATALESNWQEVPDLASALEKELTALAAVPEPAPEKTPDESKEPAPEKEKPEKKPAPKKETPKQEAPKQDAPKKPAPKPAPKKDAPKKPAPKPTPKKDAPKKPAPKKDAPKKPAPKKDAPKKPAPKKPAPKAEAPKKPAPKPKPKPKPSPSPTISATSLTSAILKETNKYRANAGLPALKAASCAEGHALSHSKTQASQSRMYHQDLYPVLDKCDAMWAGENVAYGQTDAAAVALAWFKSPPHKANMLNKRATHMAAAVAYSATGVPYYTQIFVTL